MILRFRALGLLAGLIALSPRLDAQTPPATPAASATKPAPALSPDVLAKIGDTQIKTDDIRAFLSTLEPKQREALAHNPELLKKTISTLIVQRLVLKEALAKAWDQQPAVVAELKRVRENALVESYLRSVSKPPADFPTPAQVQSVYDANKAALVVPRQFKLAQIFVACPANADAATASIAQTKLETVKKSLQQPKTDFAAIARTISDDKASGAKGGEIGWVAENQVQPEIRSQVLTLTKGAISAPIRLKDGWHFLEVLDIQEAGTPPLDQVRDELAAQMRTQKAQANSQAYLAKLLQQYPITLNAPALSNLISKE